MILGEWMAHQRKLIRQAVVALLVAANTDAGARVKDTLVDSVRKKDLPSIAVYTTEEDVLPASESTAPRELTRTVTVGISAWVAHSAAVPASVAMDDIAAQIEAAMDANRFLTTSRNIGAVDPVANTITIVGHGLTTGTAPASVGSTGTVPGGLDVGDYLYVIVIDADTIQLAATSADAFEGNAIDITDVGSGVLQLLVDVAAETILERTEMQVLKEDGASDPLLGNVELSYAVTYRTSPAQDAPTVLADLTTINAEHRIVGADDTNAANDLFTLET